MRGTSVENVPDHAITPAHWSIGLRIVFRWICLYWIVYAALNVAYRYSAGQIASGLYMARWRGFWLWATAHIFKVTGPEATYVPTPSGNTTLQYVQQAMFLAIALAGAVVWSILDRRRTEYRELHSWVRLLVRYALPSFSSAMDSRSSFHSSTCHCHSRVDSSPTENSLRWGRSDRS